MSKYVTLVFRAETSDELEDARVMALKDNCRAWMLDHALLKLDLIEKAIEEKDFEKVEKYFGAVDVSIYRHELDDNANSATAVLTA